MQSPKQDPSQTFSDALVSLGYTQAANQKFEWLSAYPSAQPLLSSIAISFDSSCVLTEEEAKRYSLIKQKDNLLPPEQLVSAAKTLLPPNPSFPSVDQERRRRNEAAKTRLRLLKVQRDLLKEELKRVHDARHDVQSPSVGKEGELSKKLERAVSRLRFLLRLNSCAVNEDPATEVYMKKEKLLFSQLVAFAKKHFDVEQNAMSHANKEAELLPLQYIIRSYGNIKAQHYVEEARLHRANAILAALKMREFSPRKERVSATLKAYAKEMRERSKRMLEEKQKVVKGNAEEELLTHLQSEMLTETLRRYDYIIDTAKFFKTMSARQRIRIMCFDIVTGEQHDRYNQLHLALNELCSRFTEDVHGEQVGPFPLSHGESTAHVCEVEKRLRPLAPGYELEMLENAAFQHSKRQLSQTLIDFTDKIGWDGSWIKLGAHPEFAQMMDKLEKLQSQNTSILEAVLKKRDSHGRIASQTRSRLKELNYQQ